MQYMGSKNRIAKHILPIMLKDRKEGQYWVEPFVGGANMIDKVTGNRIGADYDRDVIGALTFIRDNVGAVPKNNIEFSEDDYKNIKNEDFSGLRGYIGYSVSFGAKWFGGWSRNSKGDDYVARAYRSAIKQSPLLKDVAILNCSYQNLEIPNNSIIYCDPPYEGTTGYKTSFDHDKFWDWCRQRHKEGHTIFVSEYNAPDDFECIFEFETKTTLDKNSQYKRVEKLFTLR